MTTRTARNLAIAVTLVALVIFVVLTVDSVFQLNSRTPPVTAEVTAGKLAWQKYDCIGCHTILGNGSYYGPDLTKVASRRDPGWIARFLKNPSEAWPGATMPNLKLADSEISSLVAFLQWTDKVDTNGWPPEPVSASAGSQGGDDLGRRVYARLGCAGCHSLGGAGGTSAPDLATVASQRDEAWLVNYIKKPQSQKMPAFGQVQDNELEALVKYLKSVK